MRRPRHREKSNLLWKMVGVAGAINLVLWPILIHEGVFAGIRREVLIPVSLVPLPPSNKLPDTLQKVSRTSMASVPLAPIPPAFPRKPVVSSSNGTTAAIIVQKPKTTVPSTNAHVASARIPSPSAPLSALLPAVVTRPTVHPVRPDVGSSPSAHQHVSGPTPAERAVIAARIARARVLEEQGHLIAEKIAHDRSARLAGQTTGPDPAPPVAVAETPAGPGETPAVQSDTVAIVAPDVPKITTKKDPAPPVYVAAVAISKVYPAVPDRMMTTTWHATFQGNVVVHPDGTTTVEMVSSTGYPVLDQRALKAARHWKFRPARRNGKAVASSRPVVFAFDVHAVQ
jgi:protein TonB